jgi:hypothetical protein
VLRDIQSDAHKTLPSLPANVLAGFVDRGARAAAQFVEPRYVAATLPPPRDSANDHDCCAMLFVVLCRISNGVVNV